MRCFLSVLSAEACPVFYGAVGTIFIGSKTLLNSTFDLVDATDEEKEAIGKLQDCFNEDGFRAKLFIIKLVVIDSFHPLPCPATHMHSAVCHVGIDHTVMGYVTDKIYKQRST